MNPHPSGLYRIASTNSATLCTPQTPACIAVPQPTAPHFVHPRLRLVSQCLNQLRHILYTPDSGLYRSASTNCATLCAPQTPACIAVPQPTAPHIVHPWLVVLLTISAALSNMSVVRTRTQCGCSAEADNLGIKVWVLRALFPTFTDSRGENERFWIHSRRRAFRELNLPLICLPIWSSCTTVFAKHLKVVFPRNLFTILALRLCLALCFANINTEWISVFEFLVFWRCGRGFRSSTKWRCATSQSDRDFSRVNIVFTVNSRKGTTFGRNVGMRKLIDTAPNRKKNGLVLLRSPD